jgi:ketosteroid isomerase-like protein
MVTGASARAAKRLKTGAKRDDVLMKFVLVCINLGLPLILCSCSLLGPTSATPQHSPKAQADAAPRQSPKAQADTQQPPKVQAPVQQSPKAQAELPSPPPPPPATNNIESLRKSLLGADLSFSRACEEKGPPDAFYQFLTMDAVCLLAGELPIQGRDAIKVHFAAGPSISMSWKPRDAEISANAELGYTWGTCESQISSTDTQNPVAHGKYVIVWKKESDGAWKATLFATSPTPNGQRL